MKKNTLFLRNYYLISMSCVVLLLINVAHTNFVYFLPDPLQFAYSLPITYWLGLFLICYLILSGIYKQHEFLTLIIIIMYTNVLLATAFEVPRFVDVYLHISGGESLLIHNTTTVFPHIHQLLINKDLYKDFLAYPREFPTVSIFAAILKLITSIDTFLFLRIFQLLGTTITTVIVYVASRYINSKYAFLSSVGFVALYLFDTHFSPTRFAFIYYLLFVLFIIVLIKRQQHKRNILVALFTILTIFIATNPTLDSFMILVAITLGLISIFTKNKNINILQNQTIYLIIIIGIVAWFVYNAESLGIERASKIIEGTIKRSTFPTSPSINHLIYNTVEYIIIFSVFLIGMIYFVMINKIYKITKERDLRSLCIILSIFLFAPLLFGILALFTNDTAFITRNYTLLLVIVTFIFVLVNDARYYLSHKILEHVNLTFKIIIIIGLLLLPISGNGIEAFSYSPASTLFISEYLIKNGPYAINVAAPTEDIRQPLYYYASVNDKLVDVTHLTFLNHLSDSTSLLESYNYTLHDIEEYIMIKERYVIVSIHAANHLISAHQAVDYISFINNNLVDDTNIITSTGNIRVYTGIY